MRVHISLTASDLDKSRAFYSELLDAPATKVKPDYLNFRLDEPSIHLALVKSDSCCAGAATQTGQHFGLELPDAATFEAWRVRLEPALETVPESDANCCYAKANKLWLTDPDGHRWEIWHRTGEYEGMTEPM